MTVIMEEKQMPGLKFLLRQSAAMILLFVASAGVSFADPVDTLPSGSLVTIRNELTIPANRDYIVLGYRMSDLITNTLLLPYNQRRKYFIYNDYRTSLLDIYERTYGDCIETHRRYISTGGGNGNPAVSHNTQVGGRNNTVVNNTTVINQGSTAPSQSYSYVAPNNCIPPEYTLTTLFVERSGRERLIAEDKTFKVKKVKVTRAGIFNEVIIRFRHDVVKGLVILTTRDPREITISALDASGSGFLNNLHGALLGIAGENLDISLPEPEYIE
jgi:hypothetical protein